MGKNQEESVFNTFLFRILVSLKNKYTKLSIKAVLLGNATLIAIQTVVCIGDSAYIEYGPNLVICLYFLAMNVVLLHTVPKIPLSILEIIKLPWELNAISNVTKSKIAEKVKWVDIWYIGNVMSQFVIAELFLLSIKPSLYDALALFDLLDKKLPIMVEPMFYLMMIVTGHIVLMLFTLKFFYFYLITLLEVQFLMLIDQVHRFPETNNHEVVNRHLIFLIEKHHDIMRCYSKLFRLMNLSVWCMALGVTPVAVFYTVSFYLNPSNFILVIGLLQTICAMAIVTTKSQLLEDKGDIFLFALYDQLNWYEWNAANQKTLFTFLTIASTPLTWKLTVEVNVNRKLLGKLVGVVFSLANFLRSFAV